MSRITARDAPRITSAESVDHSTRERKNSPHRRRRSVLQVQIEPLQHVEQELSTIVAPVDVIRLVRIRLLLHDLVILLERQGKFGGRGDRDDARAPRVHPPNTMNDEDGDFDTRL